MTQNALLLVNLGSPASTRVEDVRRYLDQFLMDPYVVDLPWPLRRLLVSLILIKRPAESAHAYSSIWWDDGSPLIVLSRRLQEAIRPFWSHGPVELAMRYGQPAIEKGRCCDLSPQRHPPGDPRAALPAVRRQHHHHRRTRGPPGDRRASPRAGAEGAAAVLRGARLPPGPGG